MTRPSMRLTGAATTQGFAAMSAVFLLVVLAGLGAYMLSFSNGQQLGAAQDVLGTRAYWAARAGLDWGMANTLSDCPPASVFEVDGFTVRVSCTKRTYLDGADALSVFTYQALAANHAQLGQLGYVERSLSASMGL